MSNTYPLPLQKLRAVITAAVTVLIFGLLLYNYFNGGVPSHHLLNRADLPAISNWWGMLVLPLLTWLLLGRVKHRLQKPGNYSRAALQKVILRFVAGLLLGIALAISFTYNITLFLDNVLYLVLLLSLVIPIFYGEFMLGFVLGMVYTFGALLPTAFISILAAAGFILYRFVRPFILKLLGRLRPVAAGK